MSKVPNRKPTPNKVGFDIQSLKKGLGLEHQTVKEKDLTWIPFKKAFHDATGCPGVPRGYASQFRGFSNVGKSTAIYETLAGAQKLGDFCVIFDTEGSFNWEHAKLIGFKFEEIFDEESGDVINYTGADFLYFGGTELVNLYQNFDYKESKMKKDPLRFIPVVEDIARVMNEILDRQQRGELPFNITFVWDSIGSVGCFQGAVSNTNNNQWTAGALKRDFEPILNHRIPASRRVDSEYINTFVSVNKIWLKPNLVGQPTIMDAGGNGFSYGVRLKFHMGGKSTASATKLSATNGGRSFSFGVTTNIECVKNHVNGIELSGKICSTPHGFINPDEKNQYIKDNTDFINSKLNTNFDDFNIIEAEIE